MVEVKKEGVVLEPTSHEFESQAVLNPTCLQDTKHGITHMFYRAVRSGNYSSIGYATLHGALTIEERKTSPILAPSLPEDRHGIEDPRIVFFEDAYYLFYTAYDGSNASVAYAISDNLVDWKKCGIISPRITYREADGYLHHAKVHSKYFAFAHYLMQREGGHICVWDKDAFIFPERIHGKIALVHRILPEIQIAYADCMEDFQREEYWEEYLSKLNEYIVLQNIFPFENRNIGSGAPFIRTKLGWLMIFHCVQSGNLESEKQYSASAALLDLQDPQKVIGRLREPLFQPKEVWEKRGDVNNVVFPTGTTLFDDRLYIYYGAADSRIAVASVNLEELLYALTTSSVQEI